MSADWLTRFRRDRNLLPASARRAAGAEPVLKILHGYRAAEQLPPAELARRQADQLVTLARHCLIWSPHFAARMKAAGLSPEDLAEPGALASLAPLTRRELVEAGESFFCRISPKAHGKVTTTSTSGSTGEPVTVRRTAYCQLHWLACTLREHLWHDRDFSGRLAVMRANITEAETSPSWGPPCSQVAETGPVSTMPPSTPIGDLVRWLLEFDPHYLLALPSSLAGIVAQLEDDGRQLPSLQGVRTISETVTPQLREDVQRVLGKGIDDIYTSQECGVMATQCPEEGTYHVSETIIMDVVDEDGHPCGPGEVGRILVTDLNNTATPMVRYEIGDYAEVGDPCPCGRGLPSIRRFLGRERNLVLMPDGSRHWPLVGFHRWAGVFPVRQFQFVQLDRETILARMSAAGVPTAGQEAELTAILRESLGHPFEIRYEWHREPLARGPGGKFEEFLCEAR
ncbi:MAG: hypothetical protein HKN82_06045 [Akkermansiaceae bacterium]|nr:hypothetical protein [Akkermansiaceae bacterium]NNM30661.1 hypothetical protein [Akkermansiaceae bacterium]